MSFTRHINLNWTPKRVFVVTLLCCFIFVQVASADAVKFDSGSKSLANTWYDLKGKLPHERIPNSSEQIKDPGNWAPDYGIGLAKIVGPGVAIAILSILAGVIYGIFKLIRMCCCSGKKSDSDDEEEEEEEDFEKFTWSQKWVPTILYFVFFVFLLTGMVIGLLNNPRFSQGVDNMGTSVIDVGNKAIDLGNGLDTNVTTIVALIPATLSGLEEQFSGVDPLADDVVELSNDINSTSSQVNNVTTKIGQIDAGNTSAVSNLYSDLSDINNSSAQIISQMADLTYQIATKLHTTYNDTVGSLDSKMGDINDTVDSLQETAQDIIKQASDLVHDVIKYVNDGKSYDKSRGIAVMAVFIVIIVLTFAIVAGFIFKAKPIFNIVAAFGFVFLFLLWLSGSIHFLLGMALYDACPVIDVTVKGLLPSDSQAADVLQGCLYEHRSVLDSLNISAYNLTDVFDYRSEFQEVADFSSQFNFSSVDDYFNRIQNLYTYNLTEIANNITVASFGWNESYVYDALDNLNNETSPYYYSLSNYTSVDPDDFGNKNQTVAAYKAAVDLAVETNATIYNKTETAKAQLIDAQGDIDDLLNNMTIFQNRYNGIKTVIGVLETQNITNSIAILDNLQSNITTFFELGNCSFLGDAYVEIRTSLCETMQPSIDLLTVAQFLAGLALIPMVILAEVLSFRIPKCKNLNPLDYYDEDDEDYDEEKAYKKNTHGMDEIKYGDKRDASLSATFSAEPPANRSTNSSPDFNGRRRTIEDHFNSHPM